MFELGETDWLPEVLFVPDQPPEALQDEAFVELHESVLDSPLWIDVGDAESETVGAGGGGGALANLSQSSALQPSGAES